jgi:hypothetical protein
MSPGPTAGLIDMTDEAYVPVLEHRPARPYVAITSRVTSDAELLARSQSPAGRSPLLELPSVAIRDA